MAETVAQSPELVAVSYVMDYEKRHKEREPGFLSNARQDRTGGQGLALPNWTIVPVHFHCPLLEDYSRILYSAPDPDTNLRTFVDHQGRSLWAVEDSEKKLEKHEATMFEIQAKLVEAISAVENELDFWRAVQCLKSARSSLWSCHKNSSLDFTIGTYMGHAILRAALLQTHHIHKQQIQTLLSLSFEEFYSTWKGIDTVESNNCLDSLCFSCIIGICWIRFFQGQISEVIHYLKEANSRRKVLDKAHFRGGDRDFDAIYLQWALAKAQGRVEGLQNLSKALGYTLPTLGHENDFIALLEADLEAMNGEFHLSFNIETRAAALKKRMEGRNPLIREPVRQFMQQLQAGYVGNSWLLVGVPYEAKRRYKIAKKSGSLLLEAAAQVGLGNIYVRRGEGKISKESQESMYAKAESSYQQALVTYQDIGYSQGQAIIYCALGILKHKQNRLKEASSWYLKGLISSAGDRFQLHFQLSWLHFNSRDWQAAESSLRSAKSWGTKPSFYHLQGAISVAKLLDDRCKMTPELKMTEAVAAARDFKKAIELYSESQRNLVGYYPIMLTLFEQQKDAYEQLVWCIASTPDTMTDRNIQALVWSERSRSRSLVLELWLNNPEMQEPNFKNIPGLGVEDLKKVQDLELTRFDTSDEKLLWQFIEDLLEKCQLPDTLVLEYHVCADFGILIMVIKIGHGILEMVQIPFSSAGSLNPELTRQSLSAMVTGLISNLDRSKRKSDSDSEETLKKTLKKLYSILLKPVGKYLEDAKQVIIIPHEVLFNVPFQALMEDTEDRFFIERVPLSYAESLRSLIIYWCLQQQKGLRRQKHQRARKTLVVGINEHKYHSKLAEAERESATIADILTSKFGYAEGYALMGNSATKDHLMATLKEDLDIIHIASHGLVDGYLEDGAILCSHPSVKNSPNVTWTAQRDGQPNDFPGEDERALLDLDFKRSAWEEEAFNEDSSLPHLRSGFSSEDKKVERHYDEIAIRAEDLQRLRLCARLVVLSACQTAKGVILGEGVAGIGRALLMAGARCMILSHWQVSDRETSALMKDIYNELANGFSVSKAMQKAMVNVITRDKERCRFSVQKWAPFIPLGLSFLPILEPQVVQQQSVVHIPARTNFYHILLIAILSFMVVPLVHLAFSHGSLSSSQEYYCRSEPQALSTCSGLFSYLERPHEDSCNIRCSSSSSQCGKEVRNGRTK